MRTLKKTLALVLCLAMVAGLCCFGTSAAFADAAEIEYTEAVEVMNALGVLKGDGTNFNPKGILTRAEAAVMLAKLIGEGNVKTNSTFKDMAGYEWAQQFAAICEAKGFILGDGAGNFFPGQTLTGYQFGLMLCRALGYKPAQEGVESATYEIGTAALMKKIGLDKAVVNFDGTVGLTRENAAAMLLQALKTPMVTYPQGGTTVTINGAVISTAAGAAEFVTDAYSTAISSNTDPDTSVVMVELGEEYFPGLTLNAGSFTKDAFGRPANKWVYKTFEGIYPATPILTYTAPVTGGALYTALGKPAASSLTINAYWDGGYHSNNNAYLKSLITSGETAFIGVADSATYTAGNGTLIEVYKTSPTANTYSIVFINTYVGTISGWVDAVKDANGDIIVGQEEYVTVTPDTGVLDTATLKTTAFDLADQIAGTTVLYTRAGDGYGFSTYTIQSAVAATSKTVTATWNDAISFIADGTTYKYAKQTDGTIDGSEVIAKTPKTVYFDEYGYVIKVVAPAAATPNYAYVLDVDTTTALHVGSTYYAKLLYTDGTVESVVIPSADAGLEYHVVSYAPGIGANTGKIDLTDKVSAGGAISISKNQASLNSKVANDKTVYVVQTWAADTVTPVYTVYTGVTNVPALTANVSAYVADVSDSTWAVVYALDATLTSTTTTSTDVAYVYGTSKKDATDVNKGAYEVSTAIVNGVITTVEAQAGTSLDGFYDVLVKDDKGLATSASSALDDPDVAAIAAVSTGNVNAIAKDGILKFNGTEYIYDANTTVYLANPVTGVITASSIAAVKTTHEVVAGYTTNGILTTIIIEVA